MSVLIAPYEELEQSFEPLTIKDQEFEENEVRADEWIRSGDGLEIPSWLRRAIQAESIGAGDRALDILYDAIDDLCLAGRFDRVDDLFRQVEARWLSSRLMLGVLTATLPATEHLQDRVHFLESCREVLRAREEWEDGILEGL